MKKGQVILEYGIILSIILVALIAMQTYMKRGIQAVVKVSTDEFGSQDASEKRDINKGALFKSEERRSSENQQKIEVFLDTSRKKTIIKDESQVVNLDGERKSYREYTP